MGSYEIFTRERSLEWWLITTYLALMLFITLFLRRYGGAGLANWLRHLPGAVAHSLLRFEICRFLHHCIYVGGPRSFEWAPNPIWTWWTAPLTWEEEDRAHVLIANAEAFYEDDDGVDTRERIRKLRKRMRDIRESLDAEDDGDRCAEHDEAELATLAEELGVLVQSLDVSREVDDEVSFHRPGPCIHAAAQACWNKYPNPSRQAAQLRVIHKFLREYFEGRNMRPSKIRKALPIAVELVFCPTQHDIWAVKFRKSLALTRRRDAAGWGLDGNQ